MKTNHDIEQILGRAAGVSLREDEKRTMRAFLLQEVAARPVRSPWTTWLWQSSAIAALVVFMILPVAAAENSLPGEPLYVMKTHVVEPAIALTKFDDRHALTYEVARMERRLEELYQLSIAHEAPSDDSLTLLGALLEEHVGEVTALLEDETTTISSEDQVETLATLSGIVKAQRLITDHDIELSSLEAAVDTANEVVADSLLDAISGLAVDATADEMASYVEEQLRDISHEVVATSTDSELAASTALRLSNAEEALMDGNTADALLELIDAEQLLIADEHINELYERYGN